jgi:hypothetical protein
MLMAGQVAEFDTPIVSGIQARSNRLYRGGRSRFGLHELTRTEPVEKGRLAVQVAV